MPGIAEELFVESDKLPIRLYCSICLDVAEAAIITQCDHLYCKECIEQLQHANGINCECPNCRKPIQPISNALNARNFLSHQIVYCSEIESLRCGWTGKYSMWHTHKAKYCTRASKSDKASAKNATFTEIGNLSKEELSIMSVGRLKKILQEYIKSNRDKLSENELSDDFNYKKFIEKNEYITAIVKFESIYGVSGQFNNHSPAKSDTNCNNNNMEEFPTTYDGLKRLKIRELSSYLRSKNIDPSSPEYNCIEKSDLIHLVLRTQKHHRDIINGNAYDPKLEKQQFSPPPPIINNDNNMEMDDDENKDEMKSSTTYHFSTDHLRRSSINRVDINALNNNNNNNNTDNTATTYSHVYNNQQHTTNINRSSLENEPIPNNNNQRMYTDYTQSNINNYNNYSLHSHSSHTYNYSSQPPPQPPQPPQPPPMNSDGFPNMNIPEMPQWFGNVEIPNMTNISNICNNAMNTVNNTMNNVFGNNNNNNNNI